MKCYYNEFDPFAAAWLRELMADGLVPAGDVDERDIRLVQPSDVTGYDQCHFFAGIGGWALALHLAGWPPERPVWTGSCPCPPFSSAGKKKPCPECGGSNPVPCPRRTGFFICCLCGHAWLADARHLWPEQWRLIAECRPPTFLGEQVAAADGRVWLAAVRASLEILGYTVGTADLCAAGIGADHIRQRLWFMGDTVFSGLQGHTGNVGDRDEPGRERTDAPRSTTAAGALGELGHTAGRRRQALAERNPSAEADRGRERVHGSLEHGQLGDSERGGRGERGDAAQPGSGGHSVGAGGSGSGLEHAGVERRGEAGSAGSGGGAGRPAASPWSDVYWITCRDKWPDGRHKVRPVPVEPSLFPLVDAGTLRNRVGALRGAGNAINPYVAAAFITAYLGLTT